MKLRSGSCALPAAKTPTLFTPSSTHAMYVKAKRVLRYFKLTSVSLQLHAQCLVLSPPSTSRVERLHLSSRVRSFLHPPSKQPLPYRVPAHHLQQSSSPQTSLLLPLYRKTTFNHFFATLSPNVPRDTEHDFALPTISKSRALGRFACSEGNCTS